MDAALALLAAIGDVDPNQPGTQPGILLQFAVQYALPALGSLLLAAATWATAKLGQWAAAKTGSEKLGQGIEKAGEVANSALAAALADVGPKLQEAAADGVLTRNEIASITSAAMTKLALAVGAKGLEEVRRLVGVADVTAYMRGVVVREAQVLGAKAGANIETVDQAVEELRRP